MVLRASQPRASAAVRRLISSRSVAATPQALAATATSKIDASSSRNVALSQHCRRRLTTSARSPQQIQSTSTFNASSISAAQAHSLPVEHTDVAIVGGGVAGLALAASLAASHQGRSPSSSPLRIVLLEASDLDRLRGWAAKHEEQRAAAAGGSQPEHDGIQWENRVVSLTMENWEWLASLGVTQYIVQERIKPITAMHVTDGLSGAVLDLGNSIVGSSSSSSSSHQQLSNMVELSNLQQALLRYIDDRIQGGAVQVDIWDKTKVDAVAPDVEDNAAASQSYVDAWPLLSLASSQPPQQPAQPSSSSASSSSSQPRQLRTRLLVGADGPSSPVRSYAGITKTGWPYERRGLVATLRFDPSQSQQKGSTVAYQRFLPSGTIAWLPLSESSASMVWTLPPDVALALAEMHRAAAAGKDGQVAQRSILADMVTAAWRLPWTSLSRLFSLITSSSARGAPLDAHTLRSEISAHLSEALQAGRTMPEDECPPAVDVDVDARSVASFPLQVAHTEAYLGSSLLAKQAKSAPVVLPDVAGVVRDVGAWVTRLAARVGNGGSSSAAAGQAPSPPPTTPRARTVLIGDAAHSVHPLAGQGLNLGVSDVRSLTSTLTSALSVGEDVGSHEALRPYEEERWWRNAAMLFAVDRLHAIYSAPVPKRLLGGAAQEGARAPWLDAFYEAKVWARSTGVEVLNELDVVKGVMQSFAGSSGRGGGQHGAGTRASTTATTRQTTTSQPWPTKVRSGGGVQSPAP